MNKLSLLLLAGIGLLLTGCDSGKPITDSSNILRNEPRAIIDVAELSKSVDGAKLSVSYIKFDDHVYTIIYGSRRVGIAHSPTCPCHKGEANEDS